LNNTQVLPGWLIAYQCVFERGWLLDEATKSNAGQKKSLNPCLEKRTNTVHFNIEPI
jgi:hypothetical protein